MYRANLVMLEFELIASPGSEVFSTSRPYTFGCCVTQVLQLPDPVTGGNLHAPSLGITRPIRFHLPKSKGSETNAAYFFFNMQLCVFISSLLSHARTLHVYSYGVLPLPRAVNHMRAPSLGTTGRIFGSTLHKPSHQRQKSKIAFSHTQCGVPSAFSLLVYDKNTFSNVSLPIRFCLVGNAGLHSNVLQVIYTPSLSVTSKR